MPSQLCHHSGDQPLLARLAGLPSLPAVVVEGHPHSESGLHVIGLLGGAEPACRSGPNSACPLAGGAAVRSKSYRNQGSGTASCRYGLDRAAWCVRVVRQGQSSNQRSFAFRLIGGSMQVSGDTSSCNSNGVIVRLQKGLARLVHSGPQHPAKELHRLPSASQSCFWDSERGLK